MTRTFFWVLLASAVLSCKTGGQPAADTKGEGIMNVSINRSAPVIAFDEIIIAAPVERVFSVLTEIANWHRWQEAVTRSQIAGSALEGVVFKWKAGGINYTSTIHTNIHNTAFGWTGKTFGAYAVHNWYLQEHDGSTLVKVEESLSGFMISLMKKQMQRSLPQMMRTSLLELKAESERAFSETL